MDKNSYKAGTLLHKAGDPVEKLEYIISGKVSVVSPAFTIELRKCSVIGLYEQAGEVYRYDYIVLEDCEVELFPFARMSDMDRIVREHRHDCEMLVEAAAYNALSMLGRYSNLKKRSDNFFKAIKQGYNNYRDFCNAHSLEIQSYPLAEESEAFTPDKELPDWLGDYYDQLGIMPASARKSFYGIHTSLATAMLLEAASHLNLVQKLYDGLGEYIEELIESYKNSADLVDLYINLYNHDKKSGVLADGLSVEMDNSVTEHIRALARTGLIEPEITDERLATWRRISENVQSQNAADEIMLAASVTADEPLGAVAHSLDTILAYTSLDEGEEDRFRSMVEEYKKLNDKNSSDEKVRNLRHEITKYFFDLYDNAVVSAFESKKKPPVPVRLFLYFGFMDEELLGKENTLELLELLDTMENMCEGTGVYTIYDWLKAVYRGDREPSRNEFDQDFPAYLRTRRQGGFITEEQEQRYLDSPRERLRFELDNFFRIGMKIASGRPSVFCPLLSEHNITRPLKEIFVNAAQVENNWEELKKTDHSLFYRECLYQNPDYHVARETILLEVMPEVILLPVVGQRGGLWQEVCGVRRDTPGRMYLPVFANEDLNMMQLRLAGEFRWAICKRVQGVRWNDVSDRSLTSEYYDYLQFYRKNSELSSDAKEKIKTQIQSCKGSFENVFILDYMQWVRFESKGQPRLNKAAKRILFTYCPFSAQWRERLIQNPMYSDLIYRHNNRASKQYKLLASRYKKIKDEFKELPKEIENYLKYYTL
ncbi:MAG: cyclic nucleotide-binding domain-containing protein [Lachnospiraceae bacterium]|nr:cyclic nucleotide-binding domain-containing protein [Lachnospiraceae bacterium]